MRTGFRGTFVISWSQTEVDGFKGAPVPSLDVGAAWSWTGEPVRVDGPGEILRLEEADGESNIRKRAARVLRRLVGAAVTGNRNLAQIEIDEPLMDSSFVVTDGLRSYTVTLIEVGAETPPLLMFVDEMPPRDTDLWVVHHTLEGAAAAATGPASGGVICFTPGTRIDTPEGPRKVETLAEGDRVQTKDSGAQAIRWIGSRRMTGARLFAMPALRPVRIRPGALGMDRPDSELLVSPGHRMVVQGQVARALFNTPEVLVAARDLLGHEAVAFDTAVREVTYIHLLLDRHEVLWANGVETESFHPASAALSTLDQADRDRLLALHPQLAHEPHTYGGFARRNLSRSEAAILAHEAA
ncbi:Hint domain-containing protein [Roseovarius salinarum]|uniref:Hint domain-containing protein n=1 Tax=Roseovarius salinarum TaxID=1981892 RepID=UPI000C31DDC2|nr:Hint domain-containing protein [Roseovarius salinarum]